jgi:hypothetical protein
VIRNRRWLFAAAAAFALVAGSAACQRDRRGEVEQAVRTYLERLVAAYAASDETLVDPLVGEEQGRRLVGLIGVKSDTGIALEAKLLELSFVKVEGRGDEWTAETEEQWAYRDVGLKTRQQVGAPSVDRYAVRYTFVRKDGKLILEGVEFTEPPQVGRKTTPIMIDSRTAHGLPPGEEKALPVPGPAPAAPGR